jgi:hypothetical protein
MSRPGDEPSRERPPRFTLSVLALLALAHVFGLALFFRGFFLTRLELRHTSGCGDLNGTPLAAGCWSPRLYDRVVLLVIDAWRHDFAAWDEGYADPRAGPVGEGGLPPPPPFINRMHRLKALLASRPRHAALYRFVADAPTVTAQRLKGLTSGSLPTFIDIGSNFASPAIAEDNLVTQLSANFADGRGMAFVGDDTWAALFPSAFTLSLPYPSFDVKDLHTVDEGVATHLGPIIRGEEEPFDAPPAGRPWGVVVAHMLGVDHAGHRYHASHPAMTAKLEQMDGVVAGAVADLEFALCACVEGAARASWGMAEDAGCTQSILLLVLGDHGMTGDGNHGGASSEETNAALLALSLGRPLLTEDIEASQQAGSIRQVDLVPTLALATGIPIPYASLGALIPGWSWVAHRRRGGGTEREGAQGGCGPLREAAAYTAALAANAWQVDRYLATYSAAAPSFAAAADTAALRRAYRAGTEAMNRVGEATILVAQGRGWTPGPRAGLRVSVEEADAETAFASLRSSSCAQLREGEGAGLFAAHGEAQAALRAFLASASASARALWTQFDLMAMGVGWAYLLTATLAAIHAALATGGATSDEEGGEDVGSIELPSRLRAGQDTEESSRIGLGARLRRKADGAVLSTPTDSIFGLVRPGLRGEEEAAADRTPSALYLLLPTACLTVASVVPSTRSLACSGAVLSTCGWLLVSSRSAPQLRKPHGLPLPSLSLTSLAALLALIARLWLLFSDTLLAREGPALALLTCATALIALARITSALRRQPLIDGDGRRLLRIAATAAASLVTLTLLSERSLGPLHTSYAGASGGANAADAGLPIEADSPSHVTWLHTLVPLLFVSLSAPIAAFGAHALLALLGGLQTGSTAGRGGLSCASGKGRAHFLLSLLSSALVASHWLLSAHGRWKGGWLHLALPRAVYTLTAVNLLLLTRTQATQTTAASAATSSCFAIAALHPALSLVLGPWAPAPLAALSGSVAALYVLLTLVAWTDAMPPGAQLPPHRSPHLERAWAAIPAPVCRAIARILQGSDVLLAFAAGCALPGHAFAASGHAPRFSALAYGAAFVGADSFAFLPAGALLAANTFGPSALLVLAPLAVALPPTVGALGPPGSSRRAALLLHVPAALVALATCAFAAYARRHLMLWAIFAPKFAFDAVALAITLVVTAAAASERPPTLELTR